MDNPAVCVIIIIMLRVDLSFHRGADLMTTLAESMVRGLTMQVPMVARIHGVGTWVYYIIIWVQGRYLRVSLETTPAALAPTVLVDEHWNMTSSPVHGLLVPRAAAGCHGGHREFFAWSTRTHTKELYYH